MTLHELARAFHHQHMELGRHVKRHWRIYAFVTLLGILSTHWLGFNFTHSVPERLVWFEHDSAPRRGDLIVFRFQAERGAAVPLDGTRWLKHVAGVPGDVITVEDRTVYLNGERVGTALERTGKGAALTVVAPGVVPQGHYFIAGPALDSLDSRYADIGFVKREQVIALAHAIF